MKVYLVMGLSIDHKLVNVWAFSEESKALTFIKLIGLDETYIAYTIFKTCELIE